MTKLIQLKLSEDKLKQYDEIVALLGFKGLYGEYQKAIDFSISLAIATLKRQAEVLPELEEDKLDSYFSSIANLKKAKLKAEFSKATGLML